MYGEISAFSWEKELKQFPQKKTILTYDISEFEIEFNMFILESEVSSISAYFLLLFYGPTYFFIEMLLFLCFLFQSSKIFIFFINWIETK